jgi:hypothetical protein
MQQREHDEHSNFEQPFVGVVVGVVGGGGKWMQACLRCRKVDVPNVAAPYQQQYNCSIVLL